jgi:hypothetical protein
VTRCQGVFLHSSGCVRSVPLMCRSLAAGSKWAREDLSDQELPIIGAARNAPEALPCVGNALIEPPVRSQSDAGSNKDCPGRVRRDLGRVDRSRYRAMECHGACSRLVRSMASSFELKNPIESHRSLCNLRSNNQAKRATARSVNGCRAASHLHVNLMSLYRKELNYELRKR